MLNSSHSSLVLLLSIITMMVSSSTVVRAANSSFHHDLSPPLKDFTAPRAFLTQRVAARKAQEQQSQQPTTTASPQQWAVRGGAATDDATSSLLASSSSFQTIVTSNEVSSASAATLQDISSIVSPSLDSSNNDNAVMNVLAKVSAVVVAESVLFAGSHLEPLGRQVGATVAQRWRPILAAVGRHSKFLAGVALGVILLR